MRRSSIRVRVRRIFDGGGVRSVYVSAGEGKYGTFDVDREGAAEVIRALQEAFMTKSILLSERQHNLLGVLAAATSLRVYLNYEFATTGEGDCLAWIAEEKHRLDFIVRNGTAVAGQDVAVLVRLGVLVPTGMVGAVKAKKGRKLVDCRVHEYLLTEDGRALHNQPYFMPPKLLELLNR